MSHIPPIRSLAHRVLVLGTDDVASATAHCLHIAGFPVVMARDHSCPVLRRMMSFDPAFDAGQTMLHGVRGYQADCWPGGRPELRDHAYGVALTALPVTDVLRATAFAVVVDARLRRRSPTLDLRPFAALTLGLGPGFDAGRNVHVAIETAPEATGQILLSGRTMAAHGRSAVLGAAGRERFVRVPRDGVWNTRHGIGALVSEGELLGFCGCEPLFAPLSGRLRGLVRDRTHVGTGMRVAETDPRGAEARTDGIPARAAEIAHAVWAVVEEWRETSTQQVAWA